MVSIKKGIELKTQFLLSSTILLLCPLHKRPIFAVTYAGTKTIIYNQNKYSILTIDVLISIE